MNSEEKIYKLIEDLERRESFLNKTLRETENPIRYIELSLQIKLTIGFIKELKETLK